MTAPTGGVRALPPEVGGILAGLLEGPWGAPFSGLLARKTGWREALLAGGAWMAAGMAGAPLPVALWAGGGTVALWERGGAWKLLAALLFFLGGFLFPALWLPLLGAVIWTKTSWRPLGGAVAGLGVYGPWGLLAGLGVWVAETLGWAERGGRWQGMDLPVLLYGAVLLLRGMVWS